MPTSSNVDGWTFDAGGVTWTIEWRADAGQYFWRSECGRCTVARNVGESSVSAWVDGGLVGSSFRTSKNAMVEAMARARGTHR